MKAARKQVTVALILMSVTLVLNSCARDPEKAKAKYLASGQNYMKQGQYASAAIEFRNALKIDPKSVDAYYQLAQADLAQRDYRARTHLLKKPLSSIRTGWMLDSNEVASISEGESTPKQ